jgi:hypothetical protein
MTSVNKRAILQPMLDKIELGWVIAKPDPLNQCDIETECIFQHLRGYREVKIAIGNELFRLGKLDDIENLVRPAIQASERRSPWRDPRRDREADGCVSS